MTDDELDQRVRASVLADEVDTSRLEFAIRNQIQPKRRAIQFWLVAAAASIALAIAVRPQTPPLCVAAAEDHQREIVNGDPRRWLTNLTDIQSLAQKQGVPGSAIAALGRTGYRLERARLCFLKKQIFLHLVYTNDGQEFSVYLRPRGSDSPLDGTVREASLGREDLAYFQTSGLTAVTVAQHGALGFAVKQRLVLQ
jgi:hypothetical protein